jgi:hypothetical protein
MSSMNKSERLQRHSRISGNPDTSELLGFRVALAIASLPGMTVQLRNKLLKHHTQNPAAKFLPCESRFKGNFFRKERNSTPRCRFFGQQS